jgi:hypothetical protein
MFIRTYPRFNEYVSYDTTDDVETPNIELRSDNKNTDPDDLLHDVYVIV